MSGMQLITIGRLKNFDIKLEYKSEYKSKNAFTI